MRLNLTIALLLLAFTINAQVPTNGLVAYYPFDGNANDESNNGHNGTQVNTVLTTDRFGATEKAILFNGTDAYINLGSNFDFHGNFSISFYAKTLSNTGSNPSLLTQGIQDFNKGLHLMLGDSYFRFDFWGINPLDCNSNFPLVNQWAFWTFTYDAATNMRKIHLNGNLICSDNPSSDCLSVGDVLLGRVTLDNPLNVHYHGVMDEVRIYNRALTDQEVIQLFQAGEPPADITTGLIAHYPFDGNANDVSRNGNHGTPNGVSLTTDRIGNSGKAYSFDGATNTIEISKNSNVTGSNPRSVSAWVKLDPSATADNTIYKGGTNGDGNDFTFLVRIVSDNQIQLYIRRFINDVWSENITIIPGEWFYATATFDGTTTSGIKFYFNGKLKTTVNGGASTFNTTLTNPTIGDHISQQGFHSYFKGDIDEVRIYNRKLSGSEIGDLFRSGIPLSVSTKPSLYLQSSSASALEPLLLTGQNFTPNGKAKIKVSVANTSIEEEINVNGSGGFNYTFNVSDQTPSGIASIYAFDVESSMSSSNSNFQISSISGFPENKLEFLNPTQGQVLPLNKPFLIQWGDVIQNYPGTTFLGNSGNRLYNYKVEYSLNGGNWELVNFKVGSDFILRNVTPGVSFTPTVMGSYRFKVTDQDYTQHELISESVDVRQNISAFVSADLLWDFSTPNPGVTLKGVAADGVGRLYVKVSKLNVYSTEKIVSVELSLSDGRNDKSQYLGKLMKARKTNKYDHEANLATETFVKSTDVGKTDYYFWYVAPDDFFDNTLGKEITNRKVDLTVTVTLDNGSVDNSLVIPIEIVRPPLMLVHGLSGSEHTWDNFKFSINNLQFGINNAGMFKVRRAIKMHPHNDFKSNALELLSEFETPYVKMEDKFHRIILSMRKLGYAVNQVDYVCHSMGGNVLRTAEDEYKEMFYRTGSYANQTYKNYAKGWVHKVITINTPHEGSPWGDILTDVAAPLINKNLDIQSRIFGWAGQKANPELKIWSFINFNKYGMLVASDAVKEFRLIDGHRHGATDLPMHLIGGEIGLGSVVFNGLVSLSYFGTNKFNSFFEEVLNLRLKSVNNKDIRKELFKIKNITDDYERFLKYLQIEANNIVPNSISNANAVFDGDVVVALNSQLAGSTTASNRTIFRGDWDYMHVNVTDPLIVGNKVFDLLNSSVKSELWKSGIPGLNPRAGKEEKAFVSKLSSVIPLSDSSNLYDTTRIKLKVTNLFTNSFVDSVLEVKVRIRDTVNLAFVEISMAGIRQTIFSNNDTATFYFPVGSDCFGQQELWVSAYYLSDSNSYSIYDSIKINIKANGSPIGLIVDPKILNLALGEEVSITGRLVFPTSLVNIPLSDSTIQVEVGNSNVAIFQKATNNFKTIGYGSTTIKVKHISGSDTIYLNVPYDSTIYYPSASSCINTTVKSGFWSDPNVWSRGVVPGLCDSVVIKSHDSIVLDTNTQIRSLIIQDSSALTVSSSNAELIVDNMQGGTSKLLVFGNLTVDTGVISVMGRVVLENGSQFSFRNGLLQIDGNTGIMANSIQDGYHLFEVMNGIKSFSFSGGSLQIIDPPFGANSQAISCRYNFGDSSTLKLGDGISTTTSNNPYGFGGNLVPFQIGKFIMDTKILTGNRHFVNLNPLSIKSPVNINSGNLIQNAKLTIRQ